MRPGCLLGLGLVLAASSCGHGAGGGAGSGTAGAGTPVADGDAWSRQRAALVRGLADRGIRDPRVLEAIGRVERHRFVPAAHRAEAYADHPLPIGHEQTISQPFVVAAMTEAAALAPTANVLEVGTGSGYQAAVIAELIGLGPAADARAPHGRLASIEIVPELADRARHTLEELGYREVAVRAGDGYRGWPERAPFDAIVVTAAPGHVPEPLKEQLAEGGRLVIPVGTSEQELIVVTRKGGDFTTHHLFPVRFVPMTGEADEKR